MLAQGLTGQIQQALDALPARQREVVVLRDVDGLSGQEVCDALEISEANQRVLLHRGRSHLRQALEDDLGGV
jgi:RNA polymerase sigma-70 factor (ECF subfamily)